MVDLKIPVYRNVVLSSLHHLSWTLLNINFCGQWLPAWITGYCDCWECYFETLNTPTDQKWTGAVVSDDKHSGSIQLSPWVDWNVWDELGQHLLLFVIASTDSAWLPNGIRYEIVWKNKQDIDSGFSYLPFFY